MKNSSSLRRMAANGGGGGGMGLGLAPPTAPAGPTGTSGNNNLHNHAGSDVAGSGVGVDTGAAAAAAAAVNGGGGAAGGALNRGRKAVIRMLGEIESLEWGSVLRGFHATFPPPFDSLLASFPGFLIIRNGKKGSRAQTWPFSRIILDEKHSFLFFPKPVF